MYVRGIKCGDPVPTELTTGESSWEVTDRDRMVAISRLTMQLVTWLSGDEAVVTSIEQLIQVAADPEMKGKINQAFGKVTKKLGIDREEANRRIDILAEETAHVEALRDKFRGLCDIETKIASLETAYADDMAVTQTIDGAARLMKIPIKDFRTIIGKLDAQTSDIVAALQDTDAHTKFIVERRGDLYRKLWAWDAILEAWSRLPADRPSYDAEQRLDGLYRFLAQRYLPVNEWERVFEVYKKQEKRVTEKVWG